VLEMSAGGAGPSGGVLRRGGSCQSNVSKASHPLIPPWNQPELCRSSTAGMFRHPQHRRARVSGAKGSGVCCAPLELRAEPSARTNERLPRVGGGPGTRNLTPPGTHSEFGLMRVLAYPYLGDLKFTARRTPRSWRLTRTGMQLMGILDISIEKKCMVIDFFRQWATSAW
jgi:hypothetical protein